MRYARPLEEQAGAQSTQIADGSQQAPGIISKGRLEAFSDSVFAVAATLLVLGLKVPQPDRGAALSQLLAQWPAYATYAVSFMTVGFIWVNHHALIGLLLLHGTGSAKPRLSFQINKSSGPMSRFATPRDPNRTSAFMTVRVADINEAYREWPARRANF